jgi:hypothetical protein
MDDCTYESDDPFFSGVFRFPSSRLLLRERLLLLKLLRGESPITCETSRLFLMHGLRASKLLLDTSMLGFGLGLAGLCGLIGDIVALTGSGSLAVRILSGARLSLVL